MPRSTRWFFGVLVFSATPLLHAQQSKDFVVPFREGMENAQTRIVLAAGAMPFDKYSFAGTRQQQTFAALLATAGNASGFYCSRITGVQDSTADLSGRESQNETLAKLRAKFAFCRSATAALTSADLSQIVQENGPRSRAASMFRATAFWSATLAQIEMYLRLNSIIPPRPCYSANGEGTCDNSLNRCTVKTPGLNGLRFTLTDGPYTVRGDGRGAYVHGQNNVVQVVAGRAGVMVLGPPKEGGSTRSITVDLNRPVPSGGGVPLGVITDDRDIEVAAQWMRDSSYVQMGMRDIPIGSTVEARQIDVGLHINGVYHVLQIGPQPYGHCWSDGTAIHGTGTTPGKITRVSDEKWTVDLPPGSIGRLFDVHLSSPHAIDKGLYYVSLRFDIER